MISNYSISRTIFYTILTSTILTFGLLRPGIDHRYFSKNVTANHISLLSDFQSELGCTSDYDASCTLTAFSLKNNNWQLMLQVPAGKWNLQINQDGKIYGHVIR